MTGWRPDMLHSPLNARLRVLDVAAGRVSPSERKRVAILAAGPSKAQAPMHDPTWEVWSCNRIVARDDQRRFRADRWFEMHARTAQSADDLAWLRACPVPVYVPDADEYLDVPTRVQFPLERCEAMPGVRPYWTSTFNYQVALAILEGFEEIMLAGVELGRGTLRERLVEKAGLEWWLGFAAGCEVRITLPEWHEGHPLVWHPFRYGYDYDDEAEFSLFLVRAFKERGIPECT